MGCLGASCGLQNKNTEELVSLFDNKKLDLRGLEETDNK
jgi:hypothetical protein